MRGAWACRVVVSLIATLWLPSLVEACAEPKYCEETATCPVDAAAESSTTTPIGEKYGACFPEGNCNVGLVCNADRICVPAPEDPREDAGPDVVDTRPLCERVNVTTVAGSDVTGFVNGSPFEARFGALEGIAVDAQGTVYVADAINNAIRVVEPSGKTGTFAGNGSAGFEDPPAFNFPFGVAAAVGEFFVADRDNHAIRRVVSGSINTVAGSGSPGFLDHANTASALFDWPIGIAVNATTHVVYVADSRNHRIRTVGAGGVATYAGGTSGFAEGGPSTAKFNGPTGVAVAPDGSVLVSDTENHRIRKIGVDRNTTTLAGSGAAGFADGSGAEAKFDGPRQLAVGEDGNVYVADQQSHRIRRISPDGTTTTVAGDGEATSRDGVGCTAGFVSPSGLAIFKKTLFISDVARLRKITLP